MRVKKGGNSLMDVITPSTQYSIYRIDFERTDDFLNTPPEKNYEKYINLVISGILDTVIQKVGYRKSSSFEKVKYHGFEGVFFKTVHAPSWKGIATLIIQGNELEYGSTDIHRGLLDNINASYVLLYRYKNSVYALTGGFGSHYITSFIERNFGMYLLPKCINSNEPVLRQILQSNLTGNLLSSTRANRFATNFNVEKDLSGIFRELDIEVNSETASEFGIRIGDNERKKKINIISKDSLIIRRSFSLSELVNILQKVDALYGKRDRFALNYLVSARKRNYRNVELLESLSAEFTNGRFSNFEIIGNNLTNYISDGRNYILKDGNGNQALIATEPFDMDALFEYLNTLEVNKDVAFFSNFLKKWTLTVEDSAGIKFINEMSIFNAIQGFIEYGEEREPIYLYNGLWYVFDQTYSEALDAEFLTFYTQNEMTSTPIMQDFALHQQVANETAYNAALEIRENIIVAHCVKMSNVEIADAIFWDDQTIYLMHNKGSFDGEGTRDVTNQIITSAEFLQKTLFSLERIPTLNQYYQRIVAQREQHGNVRSIITQQEFADLFINRKIVYIAGYLDNYRLNTRSTYAKYLTIETGKRLATKGYGFISVLVQ